MIGCKSEGVSPYSHSIPVDTSDRSMMLQIVQSAVGTKAVNRWAELACNIALDAVRTVELDDGSGRKEIDIKKYAKVEKVTLCVSARLLVPVGVTGWLEPRPLFWVAYNVCVRAGPWRADRGLVCPERSHDQQGRDSPQDETTHQGAANPPAGLFTGVQEGRKPGVKHTHFDSAGVLVTPVCVFVSQTDIEISKEEDFAKILQMEEDYIQQICDDIIRLKPDLVFTEKGISGQCVSPYSVF